MKTGKKRIRANIHYLYDFSNCFVLRRISYHNVPVFKTIPTLTVDVGINKWNSISLNIDHRSVLDEHITIMNILCLTALAI